MGSTSVRPTKEVLIIVRSSKSVTTMAKKKGFMTPERKKKLRTLLRKKAAEELKKEQERKAEERLRVIAERCGTKADIDNASVDDLKKICQGTSTSGTSWRPRCSSSRE